MQSTVRGSPWPLLLGPLIFYRVRVPELLNQMTTNGEAARIKNLFSSRSGSQRSKIRVSQGRHLLEALKENLSQLDSLLWR